MNDSQSGAATGLAPRIIAQLAGLDSLGAELFVNDPHGLRQWELLCRTLGMKAGRRLDNLSCSTATSEVSAAAAGAAETTVASGGSFAGLGVSEAVIAALAARGITMPFAIQAAVIPNARAGLGIIARAATGSGKTLAFAVPLVDGLVAVDAPRLGALVLAPTRELVQQIADAIRGIAPPGLKVAAVFGGASIGRQAQAAAEAHIVVATPGRLLDLLERRSVKLTELRVLVLDEADRLLDMGFAPQVQRIVDRCAPTCQTLLFSATIDDRVREFAARRPGKFVEHDHDSGEPRVCAAVAHTFVTTDRAGRFAALMQALGSHPRRAIVFVDRKRDATRLAARLGQSGIGVEAIHGDRTQPQREHALAGFREGRIHVLVATDVLGRGIDVPEVRMVVNYAPPREAATFVHRVGRTGRAGMAGTAVTLITNDEVDAVRALQAVLGPAAGGSPGRRRPRARRRTALGA